MLLDRLALLSGVSGSLKTLLALLHTSGSGQGLLQDAGMLNSHPQQPAASIVGGHSMTWLDHDASPKVSDTQLCHLDYLSPKCFMGSFESQFLGNRFPFLCVFYEAVANSQAGLQE